MATPHKFKNDAGKFRIEWSLLQGVKPLGIIWKIKEYHRTWKTLIFILKNEKLICIFQWLVVSFKLQNLRQEIHKSSIVLSWVSYSASRFHNFRIKTRQCDSLFFFLTANILWSWTGLMMLKQIVFRFQTPYKTFCSRIVQQFNKIEDRLDVFFMKLCDESQPIIQPNGAHVCISWLEQDQVWIETWFIYAETQ